MENDTKPAETVDAAPKAPETNLDYKDAWIRARADYQNFKKETETRRAEMAQYAKAGLLMDLLPVISHFKQALRYIPQDQQKVDWVVGVKQIQKLFEEYLAKQEMKEIKTVGEQFDASKHEAVGKKKSDAPEGQIIEEVAPGYMMNDQVVQVAKVIVSE